MNLAELFGDIQVMVVGGVAARAYAPERFTKDVDVLVERERFTEATDRLHQQRWSKGVELFFPNSSLGLFGEAWERDNLSLDVITTNEEWAKEAFRSPAFDQMGVRVIPLAFLVLMKIDSARGIDQGDLTRMLGRIDDAQVEAIAAIVDRYSRDPQAADDVRQYAMLGRLEWETPR